MQKIFDAMYKLGLPDDLATRIPMLYGVYVNHYVFFFFLQVEWLVLSSELEDMGVLFYSQGENMIRNPHMCSIADDISTTYLGLITYTFLE